MIHNYLIVVLIGVLVADGSGVSAQMASSDSDLGQLLVIITTLVGALGGVVTAIGGIVVSLAKIKAESQVLSLRRQDEVHSLQEEINLLRRQVINKGGSPEGIEELLRLYPAARVELKPNTSYRSTATTPDPSVVSSESPTPSPIDIPPKNDP